MKKFVVLTCNRAEYYKLEPIIKIIHEAPEMELYLIVSGSHLIYDYGNTIKYIEYPIYTEVNTLVYGANRKIMAESMGMSLNKYPQILQEIDPDACIIHGDRFDVFSMAIAASLMNVPLIHIEGGELSGTIDEKIRHSITKLSNYHIVSNDTARKRVIQMGEKPNRVMNFGCPVYDKLLNFSPNPKVMENINSSGISFREKEYLICIYHPVTTDLDETLANFANLLDILQKVNLNLLMFYPNIDSGSKQLVRMIHQRRFHRQDNIVLVKSFDQLTYLSLLYYCGAIIGNSSSGIRETCAFGIPSLLIGSRQNGRERGDNVIVIKDLENQEKVAGQIQQEFGKRYPPLNLYGDGTFDTKFNYFLQQYQSGTTQKKFYDLV